MQLRGAAEMPLGFTFVYDCSELNKEDQPEGAALVIRCRDCRQFFHSDFEEPRCGNCVKRREL